MNDTKQRRYERKDSLNLVDYTILGEEKEPITHSMGRTINVSEAGMLLDTHIPLEKGQTILITVALEEDIVELEGQIVHVRPCQEKGFCSGIEFAEIDEEGKRMLKKYIEVLALEQV